MKDLTHIDEDGRARMVDVSGKPESERSARAEGCIVMAAATLAAIRTGSGRKGDVLAAARIAGIMGAKRTAELIPLCHPLALTDVGIDIDHDETLPGLRIVAWATTTGRTGVEMEALTAATIALLTIYDMAKAMDRGMEIRGVRLVEKSGGASGEWRRP
ncbi:MAG: cyclic pyranopterin monophosphate synthase MoaC [Gemmatimonadaceae bacterium]|nr:cyclic pyranopterin monophosphate synthase MoaC [Gemmatimonadaceae bacterium]